MRYTVTYTKEPHREIGGFVEAWHENTGETVVTVRANSEQEALDKAHACVNRSHMRYYSIESL